MRDIQGVEAAHSPRLLPQAGAVLILNLSGQKSGDQRSEP